MAFAVYLATSVAVLAMTASLSDLSFVDSLAPNLATLCVLFFNLFALYSITRQNKLRFIDHRKLVIEQERLQNLQELTNELLLLNLPATAIEKINGT